MGKNFNTRFIVIDDDPINNKICSILLKAVLPQSDVCTFEVAEKGFDFIINEYSGTKKDFSTILFLDINMPSWTGWEFLENFDLLSEQLKKQIKIFMLSSSVDPKDVKQARANNYVIDFIRKPLTPGIISSLYEQEILMNNILKNNYRVRRTA
jgi:response regulator RpfG family c-di-GMP phosphodiesterase